VWSRSKIDQFFVGLNNGTVQLHDTRFPSGPVSTLGAVSSERSRSPQHWAQQRKYGRPIHTLNHLGRITCTPGGAAHEVIMYGSMGSVGLWHRLVSTSAANTLGTPTFWSPSPLDRSTQQQTQEENFIHTAMFGQKGCVSLVSCCVVVGSPATSFHTLTRFLVLSGLRPVVATVCCNLPPAHVSSTAKASRIGCSVPSVSFDAPPWCTCRHHRPGVSAVKVSATRAGGAGVRSKARHGERLIEHNRRDALSQQACSMSLCHVLFQA